jgi:hypothetical protein
MEFLKLGEAAGGITPRLTAVARIRRDAGFKVRPCRTSSGWSGRS